MSAVSDVTTAVRTGNDLRTNPDALYAAAIGELKLNPAITAALSPIGQQVFHVAAQAVEAVVGDTAGKLGSAILEAVTEAVGEETVKAVEGVVSTVAESVSSAMPVLSTLMSMVMSIVSVMYEDAHAMDARNQTLCASFLSRPVIGSGYGGVITPADIFAPIRRGEGETGSQWAMPYSTLGAILCALTEENDADDPELNRLIDSNIHHSSEALDIYLPVEYDVDIQAPVVLGQYAIPKARRRVYQLLRRAMGSHNVDDGKSLWPIYMDMLSKDLWSTLPPAYCTMLLSTQYYSPSSVTGREGVYVTDWDGEAPGTIPCKQSDFDPFIQQIDQIIAQWKEVRDSHPQPKLKGFKLSLSSSSPVLIKILLNAARANPFRFDKRLNRATHMAFAFPALRKRKK